MSSLPRAALPMTVVLAACTGAAEPLNPDDAGEVQLVGGIEYRADTRVMESFPVQLRMVVTLTNGSTQPRTVRFPDGCVVLLRVYRTADRTGGPVWDQSRVVGCYMAIVEAALAPGASREFSTGTDAAEILGDSLPDGRYWLTAHLRPEWEELELDAGYADLAIPR